MVSPYTPFHCWKPMTTERHQMTKISVFFFMVANLRVVADYNKMKFIVNRSTKSHIRPIPDLCGREMRVPLLEALSVSIQSRIYGRYTHIYKQLVPVLACTSKCFCLHHDDIRFKLFGTSVPTTVIHETRQLEAFPPYNGHLHLLFELDRQSLHHVV